MSRAPFVRDVSALAQVFAHLARRRPDVVHCHGSKGGLYGRVSAALLPGARPVAVYAPHGGSMHFDPRAADGRIYFAAERLLGRLTDAIVHVCEFEAATYRVKVGLPACPARVVYNGLRREEFGIAGPAAEAADFVYFGRYEEIKGVDVLVRAVALLRAGGRDVTVALFGQSENGAMERYRDLAVGLGVGDLMAFAGPVSPRRAFAAGRVVVAPSRKESMPYGVLETAAAAVPMVVTGVGGVLEPFAAHGGPPPVCAAPGDDAALAAAMTTALEDPRALSRAVALREAVMAHCRAERMAAAVEEVYRDAIARRAEGQRIALTPSPAE
jgi:glycosyltransferase involved in cell wall biosynthesis